MSALPILYSFRRCPYAMRARLALQQSGVAHETREILLRDDEGPRADTSADMVCWRSTPTAPPWVVRTDLQDTRLPAMAKASS